MVRQFHDGMLARVQNDGKFSDPFPVTNGVKQGCVLASTLFSMMFSAMLTDAFQDGDNGIPIRYRFDEKLFNIRRLQAKSKVQTEVLDESLFADDMAKGATVNQLVDIYNTFCKALDEGKEVRAVFCDISKAFDRVWHKELLNKLKSVGVTDSLLHWCSDYLANTKQKVVIPGACSDWLRKRLVSLKVLF